MTPATITGADTNLGIALQTIYKDHYEFECYHEEQPDLEDHIMRSVERSRVFFNLGYPKLQDQLVRRAYELQNELLIVNLTCDPAQPLSTEYTSHSDYPMFVQQRQQLNATVQELHSLQERSQTNQLCWIMNVMVDTPSWIAWQFEDQILDAYDVATLIYQNLSLWPKLAVQNCVIKPLRAV